VLLPKCPMVSFVRSGHKYFLSDVHQRVEKKILSKSKAIVSKKSTHRGRIFVDYESKSGSFKQKTSTKAIRKWCLQANTVQSGWQTFQKRRQCNPLTLHEPTRPNPCSKSPCMAVHRKSSHGTFSMKSSSLFQF